MAIDNKLRRTKENSKVTCLLSYRGRCQAVQTRIRTLRIRIVLPINAESKIEKPQSQIFLVFDITAVTSQKKWIHNIADFVYSPSAHDGPLYPTGEGNSRKGKKLEAIPNPRIYSTITSSSPPNPSSSPSYTPCSLLSYQLASTHSVTSSFALSLML